jgi:hypothetical protein
LNIKIKSNQIQMDEIKSKIPLRKGSETKQIAFKRIRARFYIKIK